MPVNQLNTTNLITKIYNLQRCILNSIYAFSPHQCALLYVCLLHMLWINILRLLFLMSFIMWSSHVHRLSTMFPKLNPLAKSEEWWFAPAVSEEQRRQLEQERLRGCREQHFDFLLSGSEIVKSDVGNQYWNGRTTGHYNGKSHLAWDLVFTILLSRRPHGPMQNLAFWKQELNPP